MTSATNYSTAVEELYVAYFGRPADFYGLTNFETALSNANAPTDLVHLAEAYNSNPAVQVLVDSFGTSTESQNLFGRITGSTANTNAFVNSIFENLFGRDASNAGLNFWSGAIASQALTPSDAALAIAAGAAANTSAQGVIDAATIANKVAVATDFTTAVGTSSQNIDAYRGAAAGAYVRNLLDGVSATTDVASFAVKITSAITFLAPQNPTYFNLTTGLDDMTSTERLAVFYAVTDNAAGLVAGGQAATLNPGDKIAANPRIGCANILNITDLGLGGDFLIPGGVTLTGITSLVIASLESIANHDASNGALDFSTWAGLREVDIDASSGVDNVVAPTAADVYISDTAGNVTVHGGESIQVKTDAASIITVSGSSASTFVNLTGGGSGNGNTITDQNFGTGYANSIVEVYLVDDIDNLNNASPIKSTINIDGLTSLLISGPFENAVVNAAVGARTLAVSLSGDYFGSLTDNTATALNISASDRSTFFFSIEVASAKTISINDAANLILSSLSAPQATSVSITGQGELNATITQLGTDAVIDASGSSNAVILNFGNGVPVHFTGGTGITEINNAGANVVNITLGSGLDSVVNGPGGYGTISFAAHTGSDRIVVDAIATNGASPDLSHILSVSGLNNAGQDIVTFPDGTTNGSFQQISADQVTASGALTATLAGWVAAATGLGNVVHQSAYGVMEFQFAGNTYLVYTATASDAGVIGAHDAIVELTGTGFTFAHTSTINGGVLPLVG